MFRPDTRLFWTRPAGRAQSSPAGSRLIPTGRRLRVEPLEDRRMLSLTLFVDADVVAGGDGLGWATAYNDLQAALDDAASRNSDEVAENDVEQLWIAEGVYAPSKRLESGDARSAAFSLADGVTLYGGFAGTETELAQRDWSVHETILSGDIGTIDDAADNAYTVVYCGEDVTAALDGVTVTGGNADGSYSSSYRERRYGGGVYNAGALDLRNAVVVDNAASYYGGGVCNYKGTLSILDSTVTDNSVGQDGGGIYTDHGALSIRGSTISRNATGESVGNDGGGLYCYYTPVQVTDSTFIENSAGRGGAVHTAYSSSFSAMSVVILGNTAIDNGGGIYVSSSSSIGLTNAVLTGNIADDDGGAIYSSNGTVSVINSTLTGNTAERGGGAYTYQGSFSLVNSIVSLNTGGDYLGSLAEGSANNVIGLDPKFVRNPGTNGTDDYGDLRLTDQSAAIDTGDTSRLPKDVRDLDQDDDTTEPLPLDADGAARVYGSAVDIGAYELQTASAPGRETPSTVVTTSTDSFNLYDGEVSLREAVWYAKTASLDSPITFTEGLSGSTIELGGSSIVVDDGVTINASALADGLTIDAAGASRVLTVLAPADQSVELVGLTIANGQAHEGGGIYVASASLGLTTSTLSGNAAYYGGGIYNAYGTLSLENSVFVGNTAQSTGGGISSMYGPAVCVNATIAGNSAATGGGVYGSSGSITLINTIVARNGGSDVSGRLSQDCTNALIGVDPKFVRNPGTNGIDDLGDLRLSAYSAAIDAGDTQRIPADTYDLDQDDDTTEPLPVDMDGDARVYGDSVDIGAYEFQDAPAPGRETPSAVVTATNDLFDLYDGAVSLREALYYVGTGSLGATVTFAPELSGSTIILGGSSILIYDGVTVDASGLPGGLTVDGDDRSSVFTVIAPSDDPVQLVGLSVTGGSAALGGGILNMGGTLTVRSSSVSGNTAQARGGGISNEYGTLSLVDSAVSWNSTASGGGVFNGYSAVLHVLTSTLANNTASANGGGIANEGGTVTVTESTLSANSGLSGGAVSSQQGVVSLARSTVSGNWAQFRGGGVYGERCSIAIANATLSGNAASEGGGIYSGYSGVLSVANSTLTANSAQSSGGGIACDYNSGPTTLRNSVIAANLAGVEPDFFYPSYSPFPFSGSGNLVGKGSAQCPLIDGEDGNLVGTLQNPINPRLGPLADNGGPTFTHALLAGSPAIDAGDDFYVHEFADQRGRARRYGTVDMGAIEVQPGGFAGTVPDGFDLIGGVSVTFDPRANDLIPEGYTATVEVVQETAHGELTANPDGSYTYAPDEGFIGEDFLRYALDTGIGVNSGESIVVFNVLPEGCILVDTVEDVVDGNLSQGDVSLREALQTAATNDTVYFSTALMNRSIVLARGEIVLTKNVTLDGLETAPVTIDAAGSGRAMRVPGGVVATIEGLRITGGSAYGEGGAIINSGTLTIRHSDIERNAAYSSMGGGVFNASGTLTVTDSTFSMNSAGGGGGIYNYTGTVSVTGSLFVGNSAAGGTSSGGAIANQGGVVTVTTTTFLENSADARGGALFNQYGGTLNISRSTLSDNEASYTGGGIYSHAGTLRLLNSTVSGNSSMEGGGIYFEQGNVIEITNATLTGNVAQSRGGGIACGYSSAQTTVNNSIIAGNSADYAPEFYFPSSLPGALSGSNTLIANGSGQSALADGVNGNLVGTAADPIDPMLGPLADNGGPTLTCALLDGSPAIDAGDDALSAGSTDQRGRARIFGTVDIGAFEVQPDGVAQAMPDGLDVAVDASVTIDPRVNDFIPAGYAATIQLLSDVTHGALTANTDGTLTYVPDEGFVGEDSFRYQLDTGVGILSQEAIVVFNVIPEDCLLVDAAEDILDGDVSAGHLCLREALGLAVPGETVYFSAALVDQTIPLLLGELVLSKDVVIDGLETGRVMIDAGGRSRVFRVLSNTVVTMDGIGVTGGYSSGSGGGIVNYGTLSIRHSSVEGNTAAAGGGIFSGGGNLAVTESLIDGNRTINGPGGGIYSQSGTVSVVSSTLSRNWAHNNGGAICNSGGAITVKNSVLVGNATYYAGGGIYNQNADLVVTNSTIAGNSARNLGGGIYSTDGSRQTTLYNSILAGNVASSAPDVYVKLVTLSASHTLIANGEGQSTLVDGRDGNLIGTAEAPKYPGFVRNPSDGGDGFGDSPQTSGLDESANDDYGDLQLRADSAARDAGDDSLLPEDTYDLDADGDVTEPIPYDLDGNPRISGEWVDMGAYEYLAAPVVPGDLNGDGTVGSADLDIVRANWGRTVAAGSLLDGDPSGDGMVGSADLDIVRANWGQIMPAAAAAAVVVPVDAAAGGTQGSAERGSIVYGPARERHAANPGINDAVFADASNSSDVRAAEAAWHEAVEGLKTRRNNRRQVQAADLVLSVWGE